MNQEKVREIVLQVLKETQNTKLLFPGFVYDNKDPMMLGRIRVIPETKDYNQAISSIPDWNEEVDAWGDRDPLISLPLLPIYISQVPQPNELVFLTYSDKSYPNQNQFYIQGPISTPMSIDFDYYQTAKVNLAAGTRIKKNLSLKNNQGEYRTKKSVGIFPEPGDNAILGRGSADVVIKPDEVLLRAGKTQRLEREKLPEGYQNRAFIQLSNFKQKKSLKKPETKIKLKEIVKVVKKMVIWNITNLENDVTPNKFRGSIGLYNVIPSEKVNTKNFKPDTITKLSENTDYTLLTEIVFPSPDSPITTGISFEEALQIFNDFILGVLKGYINVQGFLNKPELKELSDQFPLIITPSKLSYQTGNSFSENASTNDVAELRNYLNFYGKIKVNQNKFESGWILVNNYKNDVASTGPLSEPQIEKVTPSEYSPSPITYGVLGAQKVYLLSQDTIGPKGQIDLKDTLYGIPQTKFVGDEKSLNAQTYPTVRGDQLMLLLRKIFSYVKGHVHPVATMQPVPVAAGNGQTTQEIDEILADAENKILNQNIRIN